MLSKLLFPLVVLSILCTVSYAAFAELRTSATINFGKPGQEQMPVIYLHGWNDDGAGWGRGTQSHAPCEGPSANVESSIPSKHNIPSPSSFLSNVDINNWAVQWWSNNNGAPDSDSNDGYAFLVTANELIDQSNWLDDNTYSAQNRPCPSAQHALLATSPLNLPSLFIKNTYNDSGSVENHALDLQDLLRNEFMPNQKFGSATQVNIVTHSKGSLVARSMLSMLAEQSSDNYEMVANVIYNAPPFTGSSTADLLARFYQFEDLSLAAILNDPIFIAAFGGEDATPMRDVFTSYINLLFGLMDPSDGLEGIEEAINLLPPGMLDTALALMDSFSLQTMRDFINDESLPLNQATELAVLDFNTRLLLKAIQHISTNFGGFPAEPALADLSISRSVDRLLARPTSAHSKQFVIGGDWGGIYARNSVFPCDLTPPPDQFLPCVSDIEDNPSMLFDFNNLANLIPRNSDGAVSTGSAFLLTETSNHFGEQMQRLDIVNAKHGDLTDPRVVGIKWLEVLLSPTTSMNLSGSIFFNDESDRRYIVSSTSNFNFVSQAVTKTAFPTNTTENNGTGVDVTVNAIKHEYRIVTTDASTGTRTNGDWQELTPGESVNFADLDSTYNLGNRYFHIQWRSINETGAKEMIRKALFAIDTDVPQVIEESIFTPIQAEVYERKPLFQPVIFNPDRRNVTPINQNIQAKWVVRNPQNKALTFVLDKRGNFTYNWNNVDLNSASANTINNASGALIQLSGLSDGLNTLYYRADSLTNVGSINSVKIFIDNSPPQVAIDCTGTLTFRCLVGPNTPLQFTVHDAQSGAGTGTIAIDGYPGGLIPQSRQFTLGETNLAALGEAAGNTGLLVPLTVNAIDLVGNTLNETLEVFYDWTGPQVTIENIAGIPTDEGYRVFNSDVLIEVSLASANGGANVPVAQIIPITGSPVTNNGFVLNGDGNYEASIYLQPGKNRIIISSQDIVGNAGTTEVVVDYNPAKFDQSPLTLLSKRIQDQCFNNSGGEVNCNDGTIDMVQTSYHGNVVAFRSRSNRLVANDTNNELDIFVWRDGIISRENTAADGSQTIDGDSWLRAISGDGRYLYFSTVANNLIDNTSNGNLYVKDLNTGELAIISRNFDGTPINRFAEQFEASVTFNGRYVFFSSRKADYVDGLINDANARSIYMVDLDPDNNGDFFDNNYQTFAISNVTTSNMANGASQLPSVSSDGRYFAFRTAATDLHADLASNGTTRDIILFKFQGNADDGTLDTSVNNRVIVPIALDAHYPKVGPDDDTVAFTTSVNLVVEDNNNQATGTDIYMSLGEGSGSGNVSTRTVELVSIGFNGNASSNLNGVPLQNVFIANEPSINGFAKKVGWISVHTNIVNNDTNTVSDLFINRDSAPFPENLPVPNWIASNLPSAPAVRIGALSPDGRYAYWVSQQEYISPYSSDAEVHLYQRRIEPLRDTTLSLTITGNGSIDRIAAGETTGQQNIFTYNDEDRVRLIATADTGWLFDSWQNVDSQSNNSANVNMARDREVTAVFTQASPPSDASANITADEDQTSTGVLPTFSDSDANDTHTVNIIEQAANGVASVQNNRLIYTPNKDFNGQDSFTFQITDRFGLNLAEAARANVTINPINDAPVSTTLSIELKQGSVSDPVIPDVIEVDANDSFSVTLLLPPLNGSVEITGGNAFRYTPTADFTGDDSFSYEVTDSGNLTAVGVASVVVSSIIANNPTPELNDNNAAADVTETKKKRGVFGAVDLQLLLFIFILALSSRASRVCHLRLSKLRLSKKGSMHVKLN